MLRIAHKVLTPENIILLNEGDPKTSTILKSFHFHEEEHFIIDYIFHNHEHRFETSFFISLSNLIKATQFELDFHTPMILDIIYHTLRRLMINELYVAQHNKIYSTSLFQKAIIHGEQRLELEKDGTMMYSRFLPSGMNAKSLNLPLDAIHDVVELEFRKDVLTLFIDYNSKNYS